MADDNPLTPKRRTPRLTMIKPRVKELPPRIQTLSQLKHNCKKADSE